MKLEGKHQGKTIHILGYFIEIEDHGLHQLFTKVEETRRQIIDPQIAKPREAGFYLEKEDVMKECNYTVPVNGSFVNVIFADPRNQDNPLIKEYKQKDNYVVRFAFDYLNVGKTFYVSQYVPDAVEAISVIYGSGGIPILAHPGSNLTIEETEVIDDLLNYGLLGLEVYTSHHNEEQEQYYLDYCRRNKIVYTCGSDFHGRFKPKVKMGGDKNNTYEVVERLKRLKTILVLNEDCKVYYSCIFKTMSSMEQLVDLATVVHFTLKIKNFSCLYNHLGIHSFLVL